MLYELTTDGRFEPDVDLEAARATARRIGPDDVDLDDLEPAGAADDDIRPRPGHPVPALVSDIAGGLHPAFPDEPPMSAEDSAEFDAAIRRRFGPDEPPPIRDARDLLFALGDALVAVGLEPDTRGDTLAFLAFGHQFTLTLTDHDVRRPGRISGDELAMLAAGMPVG